MFCEGRHWNASLQTLNKQKTFGNDAALIRTTYLVSLQTPPRWHLTPHHTHKPVVSINAISPLSLSIHMWASLMQTPKWSTNKHTQFSSSLLYELIRHGPSPSGVLTRWYLADSLGQEPIRAWGDIRRWCSGYCPQEWHTMLVAPVGTAIQDVILKRQCHLDMYVEFTQDDRRSKEDKTVQY